MPNKSERVAVITGGTTGIGAATARELAALGYRLLLVGLADPDTLVSQLRETGAEVEFLIADLLEPETAARMAISRAIELFDQLDLLVNIEHTCLL